MGTQLSKNLTQNENWIRYSLAIDVHLKQCTLDVLHNVNNDPVYQGLPPDPATLYAELIKYFTKQKIKELEKKKVLRKNQIDLILPADLKPDSSKWDITIIVLVIKTCLNLPNHLLQAIDDARVIRNKFKHGSIDDLKTNAQFTIKWGELLAVVTTLNYQHLGNFKQLEKDPLLTNYLDEGKKLITRLVADLKKDLKQEVNDGLDEKKKEILKEMLKEISEIKQSKPNFVTITTICFSILNGG